MIRGKYQPDPIDLDYPLKNGTYYIMDGGRGPLYNYFHTDGFKKKNSILAMDIVKMNKYGLRSKNFFPKKYTDFNIYEENVYSPCDGLVVNVINDIDETPLLFKINAKKLKLKNANLIEILYKDDKHKIQLAHFLKGTITLKTGDKVTKGDYLGKIGNSGSSALPHLHFHVKKIKKRNWVPGEFTFNKEFYYTNKTFTN